MENKVGKKANLTIIFLAMLIFSVTIYCAKTINEENIITKVCKVEKSQFEVFYLIYDKVNKNFLECIIPKAEFEQRYLDRSDFDKSKGFFIKEKLKILGCFRNNFGFILV